MLPRKLSHSPGKEGRPREFANFPKLPSSRLVLGAGREAEEAAVPAAGRMRLDGGGPGGFALSEFEAVSKEERKACPPWWENSFQGPRRARGGSGTQGNSCRNASSQCQCSLCSESTENPRAGFLRGERPKYNQREPSLECEINPYSLPVLSLKTVFSHSV